MSQQLSRVAGSVMMNFFFLFLLVVIAINRDPGWALRDHLPQLSPAGCPVPQSARQRLPEHGATPAHHPAPPTHDPAWIAAPGQGMSRRIITEQKAKVVAASWGTELPQFFAALAIFHQDELMNRLIGSLCFNSSWCKSAYSSNRPALSQG